MIAAQKPAEKQWAEPNEATREKRPARNDVDESISTYNGASNKKYNWSQSIKNVDV